MATFRDAVTAAALGSGRAAAVLDAARAVTGELHGVVLVEGPSDRAAVEALAVGRGRDLLDDGVLVLDMGGATNVARFATVLEGIDLELRVAALCDQDQQSHYRRAFDRVRTGGGPVPAPAGPVGVFVCGQDLEDELIRTLGVLVVEDVIRAEGELPALRTFRRQPAQRQRSAEQQLHRFLGTLSGRKIRYAAALAGRCDPDRTPDPLRALFDHLAGTAG